MGSGLGLRCSSRPVLPANPSVLVKREAPGKQQAGAEPQGLRKGPGGLCARDAIRGRQMQPGQPFWFAQDGAGSWDPGLPEQAKAGTAPGKPGQVGHPR